MCPPPPGPIIQGDVSLTSCGCSCGVEAPANLLLMANAAVSTYVAHNALCGSADTVPGAPPTGGRCYQPVWSSTCCDFFQGSSIAGWDCLGVGPKLTAPVNCAYGYHVGSGYVGPALGGPDPGPNGFEVSAQGYDGTSSSTFTIAGTFDPATGTFTLSPLFQHGP